MTREQFVSKFVQMLRSRLGGNPEPPELHQLEEMDPSSLDEPEFRKLADSLMRQIPAVGSCTYVINVKGHSTTCCVTNVSKAECDGLHGVYDPGNTCPVSSGDYL
jgi:hypothetical protein